MFLKNQWNNMGIKSKTFIATISSVTFGLIILYIILYLFVTKVYILYKKANLRGTVEAFISDLDSEYFININQTLDDFCLDNDLMIIITDEEDTLLYSSSGIPYFSGIHNIFTFLTDINSIFSIILKSMLGS